MEKDNTTKCDSDYTKAPESEGTSDIPTLQNEKVLEIPILSPGSAESS